MWLKNQRCYGKTETTAGFSASNRSKTNPPRYSNCRLVMLYKVVKKLWAEFFALRLWRCSGQPSTTSRAMDKWMLRLDSADQKGPEITLEGILIVVEGCFTAERNGSPIRLLWRSIGLEPCVLTECWLLVWFLSLFGYCWIERT